MDLLNKFKNSTVKTARDRKPYKLDEVLAIMAMFGEGLKPKQVAQLTGRSVHSLRYKFLEGEIELNGEAKTRSIKKFTDVKSIYESFGVAIPADIDTDVTTRIDGYKQLLLDNATAKAAADAAPAVEESNDEGSDEVTEESNEEVA